MMKLADASYASVAHGYKNFFPPRAGKPADGGYPPWLKGLPGEDEDALLDLSSGALEAEESGFGFLGADSLFRADRADESENKKGSGVDDPTARLTKRLVLAATKNEVMDVLSEAYKALGDALMAAADGDEDAMAVVRRLNKLIRRCNRKNRDLDKEAELVRKEKKAKKQELEQLAKQHEIELKRRMAERKKREKKYLQDMDEDDEKEKYRINLGSVPQAELEAMMRQMLGTATVMAITGDTLSMAGVGAYDGGEGLGGNDGALVSNGELTD